MVAATGSWRDLRTPGAPLRVVGISIALSLNLILYFLAIRYTGVAVAIFLSYLAPVYLAFVAPRILKETTEPVVYVALAVGLAGMALILVPGLVLEGVKLSAAGLLCAWGGRRHVRGVPAVRQEPARPARAQHAGGVRAERLHRRRDARPGPARR